MKKGYLEFPESEEEEQVEILLDTGAGMDIASQALVDKLHALGLVELLELPDPIPLGSVSDEVSGYVTHSVTLRVRLSDYLYPGRTFGVFPNPHQDIILGMPWIRDNLPQLVQILCDTHTGTTTDLVQPVAAPTAQTHCPPEETPAPIPQRPSSDPEAAFSAGGVIAAIEAEQTARQLAAEKHALALQLLSDVLYQQKCLQLETAPCPVISSASPVPSTPDLRDLIPTFARRFLDTVFSDDEARKLPPHRPGIDCEIILKEGATRKTSKLYDLSKDQLEHLEVYIRDMLDKGFIRPSTAGNSVPVFFVTDKESSSRGASKLRLVVDFRDLNANILDNEYPLPLARLVMEALARGKIFTKLDLRDAFFNLRLKEGSEELTAFKTHFGQFEYTVMPMGLKTAPAYFQHFVNQVLGPYLNVFCFAYLDDIIIFSQDEVSHEGHVTQVLEALEKHSLHVKPAKCVWGTDTVSFLGFTAVAGKGIRMSEDKIAALLATKSPRHLTDLRSFLGFINFYDRFIPHFSDRTAVLTQLTKKDEPWRWDPDVHEVAFRQLLAAVRDDVYLASFDWNLPTQLETDASDVAYGGCISQQHPDGHWRPVLFFHHKFKDHEKNWDIHDKELYAIVFAFDRYRHYLSQLPTPVAVYSDHRNLSKFMFTTDLLKSHDGRLGRWWEVLSQSHFTIEYRPGIENPVADFLSRYGYDDSAALDARQLLPASRFSPKALTDILSWFKTKDTDKNIRALLEKQASEGTLDRKKKGSPLPVEAVVPTDTPTSRPRKISPCPHGLFPPYEPCGPCWEEAMRIDPTIAAAYGVETNPGTVKITVPPLRQRQQRRTPNHDTLLGGFRKKLATLTTPVLDDLLRHATSLNPGAFPCMTPLTPAPGPTHTSCSQPAAGPTPTMQTAVSNPPAVSMMVCIDQADIGPTPSSGYQKPSVSDEMEGKSCI